MKKELDKLLKNEQADKLEMSRKRKWNKISKRDETEYEQRMETHKQKITEKHEEIESL